MYEITPEYAIAFQNYFTHKMYIVRSKLLSIKAIQEDQVKELSIYSEGACRLLEGYHERLQKEKSHDRLENRTTKTKISWSTNRKNYSVQITEQAIELYLQVNLLQFSLTYKKNNPVYATKPWQSSVEKNAVHSVLPTGYVRPRHVGGNSGRSRLG